MENNKKVSHLQGGINLKSNLTIEEVGEIISTEVLGGIRLGGKEKNIYEEIPAIFNAVLGFSIVLQGYSGMDHEWGFVFSIISNFNTGEAETYEVSMDNYLSLLFKERLKEVHEIKVIELET